MNIINKFTLRTLLKNKTRTLVTIIGIALSVAMFTAVTSIIVSFQQYLVDVEIDREGSWHAKAFNLDDDTQSKIEKDDEVLASSLITDIGYSPLANSSITTKPYLFIAGISRNYTDFAPLTMVDGRMPKNASELVISSDTLAYANLNCKIGDSVTLAVGTRSYTTGDLKGQQVGMQNISYSTEKGYDETITDTVNKTYTIVGVCEQDIYKSFIAPGFTAFTLDSSKALSSELLLTLKHPEKSDDTLGKYCIQDNIMLHSDLLRFMGKSTNSSFNNVLYGMATILIIIIMLGSISLIYNAFSISLSERTKQFGLLKSIGATKKQMRHSVLFEALFLCIFGIPIGLIAGLGGIAITFHFISRLLAKLLTNTEDITLTLCITWQSLLIAVGIGLITILISAMIPARKAVKIPAIQAIRQTNDIKIRANKVRTSPLVFRLFHFEGMLANKNFKRNRRKYRATIISLFISVVLFITATSFSSYMQSSINAMQNNNSFDLSAATDIDKLNTHTEEDLINDVKNVKDVDDATYNRSIFANLSLPANLVSSDYLKVASTNDAIKKTKDGKKLVDVQAQIYFVQDTSYENYLKKNNLNINTYTDTKNLTPLVWDNYLGYLNQTVFTCQILKKNVTPASLFLVKDLEGYSYSEITDDSIVYTAYSETGKNDNIQKIIPKKDASISLSTTLHKVATTDFPLGISDMAQNNALSIMLPYSALELLGQTDCFNDLSELQLHITAKNHASAYENLQKHFKASEYGTNLAANLYDYAESMESDHALALLVNIFAYGFIILISLICVANVFNTISTNISLRRQEFAMLKSVGMTRKGFNRMMNFECIMYGAKSLLFGIPTSIVLNYLMYKTMGEGMNAEFLFPIKGILFSILSVFLVVFITMLYAMNKIKKDNPIEALRNENL